jgi:hypothetical protein
MMEAKGSLSCSLKPVIGPYTYPVYILMPYFSLIHLSSSLPPMLLSYRWSLSLSFSFVTNILYFSYPPHVLCDQPILPLFDLVTLSYKVKSRLANYLASYIFLSILLLLLFMKSMQYYIIYHKYLYKYWEELPVGISCPHIQTRNFLFLALNYLIQSKPGGKLWYWNTVLCTSVVDPN